MSEPSTPDRRGLSRRSMLRGAGAVGLALATTALVTAVDQTAAQANQTGWNWCVSCGVLFFGTLGPETSCPTNGRHVSASQYPYVLKYNGDGGGGQESWRWCATCSELHNGVGGICWRTNSAHGFDGGFYRVETSFSNDGGVGLQDNWRWCHWCEGLWFNGSAPGTSNSCARGSGFPAVPHSAGSWNYLLRIDYSTHN